MGALEQLAHDTEPATAFQQGVVLGWLNFCAVTSLGPRGGGATLMHDANRVGGSALWEWRLAHPGFVEIIVDFPDHVVGLDRVAVRNIWLANDRWGAAEIIKRMRHPLDQLHAHRRIWLGQQGLVRLPDLLIAPGHRLEVNGNSSLLAAIATGERGRLIELLYEGRSEELDRIRLIERARQRLTSDEPARIEDNRIARLNTRRHRRAINAQQGAAKLVAWLHQFTTDKLRSLAR